jgi:hypothetical protein
VTAVEAVLRAERLAIGIAGVAVYLILGGSWLLLVPLLLAIDLSMLGYLAGPRVGAVTYNAAHNFVIALLALAAGWWSGLAWLQLLGAAWLGHVGVDRALGYGLKLPTDFRDTHLGRIGRDS